MRRLNGSDSVSRLCPLQIARDSTIDEQNSDVVRSERGLAGLHAPNLRLGPLHLLGSGLDRDALTIPQVTPYYNLPAFRLGLHFLLIAAFVLAIVKSMPFQMRQADGQLAPPASSANPPAAKRAQ